MKDDYPSRKLKLTLNETKCLLIPKAVINDAIVDIFNCIDKDSNGVLEKRRCLEPLFLTLPLLEKYMHFQVWSHFSCQANFKVVFKSYRQRKMGA